jgi:hypothetical protein
MYAILSLHTPNYRRIADVTWPNKVEYAAKHGYQAYCKMDGFTLKYASGEKVPLIKEYFLAHPEVKWAWWLDADTLITNFHHRIEDHIDDRYHFIISSDIHGMNAGSFFIRNSLEGRTYINWMLAQYPVFETLYGFFAEQKCVEASYEIPAWKKLIKIVPQKDFNSYDLWPNTGLNQAPNSIWEPGDFVVHWPGSTMENRVHRHIPFYADKIIK